MWFIPKHIGKGEEGCSFLRDKDLCEKNSSLPVSVDDDPLPTTFEIVKWKYMQHVGSSMVWWTYNLEK